MSYRLFIFDLDGTLVDTSPGIMATVRYVEQTMGIPPIPEEQLRRIAARNGPAGLEAFRQRWIPLEEGYFEAFALAERCELVLALDGTKDGKKT